ncbi:MAG: class IV adenylate cyclase [Aureispira sp.]
MNWKNVEIKAHCTALEPLEKILLDKGADYKGLDHQIDTYFQVPNGRLKLREGTIECALIHYNRANQLTAKRSEIHYYKPTVRAHSTDLKRTLEAALGIKVIVDKQRHIFFIDNVKFHLDQVQELGTFVEIEAIDQEGIYTEEALQVQCLHYQSLLGIEPKDLIAYSYSDLLLER